MPTTRRPASLRRQLCSYIDSPQTSSTTFHSYPRSRLIRNEDRGHLSRSLPRTAICLRYIIMPDTDQLQTREPSNLRHRSLEELFVRIVLRIARLKCELFRRRHQNGLARTHIACHTLAVLEGRIHLHVSPPTTVNLQSAFETLRAFEHEHEHLFGNEATNTPYNPTNPSRRPFLGSLRPSPSGTHSSDPSATTDLDSEGSDEAAQHERRSRTPQCPQTYAIYSNHAWDSFAEYYDFLGTGIAPTETDGGIAGSASSLQEQRRPRYIYPATPSTRRISRRRSLHQRENSPDDHATPDRPERHTWTPRTRLRRSESEPPAFVHHSFQRFHSDTQLTAQSWEHRVATRRRRILLEATRLRITHIEVILEDIPHGQLREIFCSLWRHFLAIRNVLKIDDALLEGGDVSTLLDSPIGTPPPPYSP
ncbi:uncharacterized protein EI97DRAFT_188372 [Westerdykella ornata]|uniref:Uncharacterized protein n=1 Tax=Westerdykella ornata TaxID=318751 RepID=A0A6A6JT89_WESOR|nr:uncharacterized protein EI97DRAFT_188372 [Westerdykella ornata]KAF2279831.1 hypothetical protein EI97DRAFT_188372 [Westerdykella ornata]